MHIHATFSDKTSHDIPQISTDELDRNLSFLCNDIGERLAGHTEERQAAAYIADEFAACGTTVTTETFPIRSRQVVSQELQICINGKWESFPCSLFSNTPGTNGEWIEAPLVVLESPAITVNDDLSHLRHKGVVHLGCHIESRQAYQRLIEAEPAFMLFVDIRYPGNTPLADGMFPAYTDELGAIPTVNVAYMDAWRWQCENASAARLRVEGGMTPAESQNVIGILPGSDPDSGVIYIGAHHDTQADTAGANDNASGVISLIALARSLANRPRLRDVRLISFGAEEQLSQGSTAYVRRHRTELSGTQQFMFNMDSCGSHLGWNELYCLGPTEMAPWIRSFFAENPLRIVEDDIMPYADHFPFGAAGVPAVTFIRPNCTGGHFFHHRPDDDSSRLSLPGMTSRLKNISTCVESLANCVPWPFTGPFQKDQQTAIEAYWKDLFGGWNNK